MSVADVTSRIAQIQGQLALLAPTPSTGTNAAFSSAMTAAADMLPTSGAAAAGTTSLLPPTTGGSAEGQAVVAEAKKYLGLPYVWGGTDPTKGMDCSGLVQVVYKNLGYELPRVSFQQAASGRPVASMAEAQPGDLLAWDNSSRNNGVDHIAIYIGGGKMIEAPRTGLDIRIIDVPSTPTVIRRIIPDAGAADLAAGPSAAPLSYPMAAPMSGTVSGAAGATTLGDVLAGAVGLPGAAGLPSGYGLPSSVGVPGLPAATAPVPGGTPYSSLFEAASARYGVPAALLSAVARQESGYDPSAVSPAGAQGLMQLMPATARGLGVTDSFDPTQAVDGAARLLRDLLDRFGRTDLALAAYNAGPGAVMRYGGVPPYAETQNYVTSVMSSLGGAR